MPTPTTGQKINGHVYSNSSLEAKFADAVVSKLEELNYGASLEPGKQRGTSSAVLGRTKGEGDSDGSFKMDLENFNALKATLGDGYMEVSFQIVASYAEANAPVITDVLNGVRITSQKKTSSGSDPVMVECDIHIMELIEDGIRPYTV